MIEAIELVVGVLMAFGIGYVMALSHVDIQLFRAKRQLEEAKHLERLCRRRMVDVERLEQERARLADWLQLLLNSRGYYCPWLTSGGTPDTRPPEHADSCLLCGVRRMLTPGWYLHDDAEMQRRYDLREAAVKVDAS